MKKLLDWDHSTSLFRLPLTEDRAKPDLFDLNEMIENSAQMLPADGPITGFAFLNPLHAFEHLPFEEAVKVGHRLFGGQPYLPESRYRAAVERQRIRAVDLQAVLEEELGKRGWEMVSGLCSRLHLRMAMLRHPMLTATAEELQWHMMETDALKKFRSDVSVTVRNRVYADTFRWVVSDIINQDGSDGAYARPGKKDPRRNHILWPLLERFDDTKIDFWSEATWEEFAMQALWRVCDRGVRGIALHDDLPWFRVRPRDILLEATGEDSDGLVHELLIRICAAFTDQGFAQISLPNKELGLYKSFLKLYRVSAGPPDRWMRGLAQELARLDDADIGPMESIRESLEELGISKGEWEEFFPSTMLALRGWASIIRQMEARPDRFPRPGPVGTLNEYLAVRLILERFALAEVARRELGYSGPLRDLRAFAQSRVKGEADQRIHQRVFSAFQLAQFLGWSPSALHKLTPSQWGTLVAEIEAFNSLERRRVFHAAFEHGYRTKALDAVSVQTKVEGKRVAAPKFQVSFCIDAREESFRRHLEEICPEVETFAAAGFYSIAIQYRGLAEANYRPLCPIVVQPQHYLVEEPLFSVRKSDQRRAWMRRILGAASHRLHTGSRSFALGALLSAGLGVLSTFPLVIRVLFPRWAASIRRTADLVTEPPDHTRLCIERSSATPGAEEEGVGFTLEEMVGFAERVLRDIGLTSGFARLFIVLGHQSQCLNNPHKSTYDCGACTGPGGPNARALAMMINDPRVRTQLAQRGIHLPADTVFVAGVHNTATESVSFYDLDLLPKSHYRDVEEVEPIFQRVSELNAHERCRRFDSVPLNESLDGALRHVEHRAEDLAQVRPEFGNATNALCIVGRRERFRGLFLDRRSFQHSYDPTQDDADSSILARILSAVIPVCQGINLQYFFSSIDPDRWGAGTKLPHNVTSLLGVMDGAASDLRLGLPWQSVEIHESMRILFVIETTPEAMLKIMEANPVIDRIIRNRWAQLAVLAPGSNELQLFRDQSFQAYHPENTTLPKTHTSGDWYRGSRTFLDFAQIQAQ